MGKSLCNPVSAGFLLWTHGTVAHPPVTVSLHAIYSPFPCVTDPILRGVTQVIFALRKCRILSSFTSIDTGPGITEKDEKIKQNTATKFSNIKIEQFIQDTEYDLLILSGNK